MMEGLTEALQKRRQAGLYRSRRVISTAQQPELVVDGKAVIAFCSNDYLGLANHPDVVAAMQGAAGEYGVGSGAAHLITGHSAVHHRLEEALAAFTGRPRALLFSTGYMANLGVISALLGQGDRLYEDRLNHASLVDAGQLTRAKMARYQHGDAESLRLQLARGDEKGDRGQTLIATDGVFSMDGDLAPLPSLVELARQHQAWLMVDDAHGMGVLGEDGGGILSHFGMDSSDVPVLMGTLGKGLGTYGAFVAGSEALIETLIQHARSYIYTTAPPAALAQATLVSLGIAQRETWRRERLRELITHFRQSAEQIGLSLMDSFTPIQPILAGSSTQAVAWSRQLEQQGILVSAIRPPTVPDGSARLRITLSASHTDHHLTQLLDALATLPRVGV